MWNYFVLGFFPVLRTSLCALIFSHSGYSMYFKTSEKVLNFLVEFWWPGQCSGFDTSSPGHSDVVIARGKTFKPQVYHFIAGETHIGDDPHELWLPLRLQGRKDGPTLTVILFCGVSCISVLVTVTPESFRRISKGLFTLLVLLPAWSGITFYERRESHWRSCSTHFSAIFGINIALFLRPHETQSSRSMKNDSLKKLTVQE